MNSRKRLLIALPLLWLSSTYPHIDLEPTADGSEDEHILYQAYLQRKLNQQSAQSSQPEIHMPTPQLVITDFVDKYKKELQREEAPIVVDPLQKAIDTLESQIKVEPVIKTYQKESAEKGNRNVEIALSALSGAVAYVWRDNPLVEYGALAVGAVFALDAIRRSYCTIPPLTTEREKLQKTYQGQLDTLKELRAEQASF